VCISMGNRSAGDGTGSLSGKASRARKLDERLIPAPTQNLTNHAAFGAR